MVAAGQSISEAGEHSRLVEDKRSMRVWTIAIG